MENRDGEERDSKDDAGAAGIGHAGSRVPEIFDAGNWRCFGEN
jgi:hypothetical protein